MKVFVNEKNEIKAINISNNESLVEIEVDRDEVFGTMSDFKILHYSIKKLENNIVITYPTIDTELLDKLEIDYLIVEQSKKIDILNAQNANLLLDNAKKEIEISTLNKNLANVTLEVAKMKVGA